MNRGRTRELQMLLRLRELRVAAAAQVCAEKRQMVDEAEAAIVRRQQRIDDWKAQRASLAQQVIGPAARDIARFMPLVAAQRDYLEDQLERDVYGLIDDEDDRDSALERLAEARAEWTRERAREDGVHDLLQEARGEHQRAEEQRADMEADERLCRPPAGGLR